MRKVILFFALMAVMSAQAKTTYIPTYKNYLHIVTGGDTLAVTNNLDTLELADPAGMFTLRIDQEDVTHEKVKAIKRSKRAANWAGFAAVMSGVSTAFSENSLQYMVRSTNTQTATTLADLYAFNANEKHKLEIDLWIDNTSDGELMVCDMERGLTWWILPHQSMRLRMNNPEAAILRISDSQNHTVRYVTALAGSKVTKYDIVLETDDHWYSPVYHPDKPKNSDTIVFYLSISKRDYAEERISVKMFEDIKMASKQK